MENYNNGLDSILDSFSCETDQNENTSTGLRTYNPLHNEVQNRAARFKPTPDYDPFAGIKILKEYGLRMLPNEETGAKWTRSLLLHIELLVKHTSAKDWQAGEAIVWMSVGTTAKILNLSSKQVSKNEKKLSRLGVLYWKDAANRKRFGRRDQNGNIIEAYGVNITALGTMLDDFREEKKRIDEEDHKQALGKKEIDSLRAEYRTIIHHVVQNKQAQSKTYARISKITEQAKEFLTKRIPPNNAIDVINYYIHRLSCLLKHVKEILNPSQSPGDNEEICLICGQRCGQTCGQFHIEPQKEVKKDQLACPKKNQLAPPEKGSLYNTKPIDISIKSTNRTTEPEEPPSQDTQEPDVVQNCQKGEGESNEDNSIKWHSRDTDQANQPKRTPEEQRERDERRKNYRERYDPYKIGEFIDLTRVAPWTPSFIRHQWDGTWLGLSANAEEWREDLGLSEKITKQAIKTMGESAAAITILIILWKNHLGLINSTPTAYLWGIIKKANSKNLNLPKTIYSLQNRSKAQYKQ